MNWPWELWVMVVAMAVGTVLAVVLIVGAIFWPGPQPPVCVSRPQPSPSVCVVVVR